MDPPPEAVPRPAVRRCGNVRQRAGRAAAVRSARSLREHLFRPATPPGAAPHAECTHRCRACEPALLSRWGLARALSRVVRARARPTRDHPSVHHATLCLTPRGALAQVLLHNDDVNRREYVVQVLLKVVDGMSMDDAIQVMSEAHQYGKAVCIVAPQPDAEDYCEQLRSHGLIASIQPQGGKN